MAGLFNFPPFDETGSTGFLDPALAYQAQASLLGQQGAPQQAGMNFGSGSSIWPTLMGLGAGIAAGGAPGGGGWGGGIGKGLALGNEAIQNQQSQKARELAYMLQLATLQNQMNYQNRTLAQGDQQNAISAYGALPSAIKEQMPPPNIGGGAPSGTVDEGMAAPQYSAPVQSDATSAAAPTASAILPPAQYEAQKAGLTEQAKKEAETRAADIDKRKVGDRVGKVATMLYKDIKKNEKLFSRAAGPFTSYMSEASPMNPLRAVYEDSDLASGQNAQSRAYLSKVKQYTQSLKSELQRAYLKGTGPATEAERAEINKLIDDIPSSRSAAEAYQKIGTLIDLMNTSFGTSLENPEPKQSTTNGVIDFNEYFGR